MAIKALIMALDGAIDAFVTLHALLTESGDTLITESGLVIRAEQDQ